MTETATSQKTAGMRLRRAAALTLGAALGFTVTPAAAIPEGWETPDNPSLMGSLLLIGGPVIAVIAVIALLTYLPSMIRGRGPDEIAYNDPTWFGGPRAGVKEDAEAAPESGGSGGRW